MRTSSLPILMACAAALFMAQVQADDDGLTWFDNYSQALQEAKRTGKPLFLEYRCEP